MTSKRHFMSQISFPSPTQHMLQYDISLSDPNIPFYSSFLGPE